LDASEEDIRVLFSDEDERPEEGTGEDDDDGEGEEETEYGFSDYENAHAGFVIPWSNDAVSRLAILHRLKLTFLCSWKKRLQTQRRRRTKLFLVFMKLWRSSL